MPVQTLKRLQAMLLESTNVTDVAFHGGAYYGSFIVPMPLQEDTGIEVYYDAGGQIVLRGNVCKGFACCGIFIKCGPGEFTVENNTLVNNLTGIGWSGAHTNRIVTCRRNIIYGSPAPFNLAGQRPYRPPVGRGQGYAAGKAGVRLFPAEDLRGLKKFSGKDRHSIFADPRYHDVIEFDFRLEPGSPNIGAMGVYGQSEK